MDQSSILPSRGVSTTKQKTEKRNVRLSMYLFVKRTFDIVSSGIMLLLTGSIILICLLVKWLEDVKCPAYKLEIKEIDGESAKKNKYAIERADGKFFECKLVADKENKKKYNKAPIYSSVRVGQYGRRIAFHKIRSMCPGAEEMKDQLIEAGLNESDPPAFKMKNDPRITKFGKFLRKFSIDELPQLWDIFIGKMSVVGPRPPIESEVANYTAEQLERLDVKGGLLCLWQIQHNRNELSFDDWVSLDLEYIEKRSIWLDLKIIFKGAYMVLFDHSGE